MKTFTTTLALVLTATVMMAFPRGSKLTIEVMDHRANTLVVVDGQKYNAMNNIVELNGLQPGNYPVKVLRPTHWGDHGVVFKGMIKVPHRSDVNAVISRRGMSVKAVPLAHHGGSYWDNNNGHGNGTTVTPNANGNGGFVSINPQHQ